LDQNALQPHTQSSQPLADEDEIDLHQLARTFWHQRYLILGFGLFGALLGLALSLYSTKYVSESLLQVPGLTLVNYKVFRDAFSKTSHLDKYLELSGQVDHPWAERLRGLISQPEHLNEAIKPEFVLTDKEQKTFGIQLQINDLGSMVGLSLRLASVEPDGGSGMFFLGEYLRDTLILAELEQSLSSLCEEHSRRLLSLRNEQLQHAFNLQQQRDRQDVLSDILSRNPEQLAIDPRQILSLDKATEPYLPPAAQIAAMEIRIADMQLAEVARERELQATSLKRDFYCQARESLDQPTTGRAFLVNLLNIQEAVFQHQDRSVNIIEQTWNEFDLQRQGWNNQYLTGFRFVVSPEGAEFKQRKPGLIQGGLLGGFLGGFLGLILALLRKWWREHRSYITG
jgi:hypothetical protein